MLRNKILRASAGQAPLKAAPLTEKNAIHVVALVDGEVAGTLFLIRKNATRVQIKQVAVSEDYQGLGLGKQLMNYAEKLAQIMGFQEIYLEGRESAWRFYERLGYEVASFPYEDGKLLFKHYLKAVPALSYHTSKVELCLAG